MKPSPDAERLNEEGRRLRDEGDVEGAESAYREAIELNPEWSIPVYNLALLYKYEGRWEESLELNRQAAEMSPDDEASWWNLGIAATALSSWEEARRAWSMCGMSPPAGDGPPDFNFGLTPVRLDPASDAEVVWAHRIDPARARIANIPLPTSRFHWGDIVLIDGAVEGEQEYRGRAYPVFNVLEILAPSQFRTFVLELAAVDDEGVSELERIADERGCAAENWPTYPHCGLAARDAGEAQSIISDWLERFPQVELTEWYEVTPPA